MVTEPQPLWHNSSEALLNRSFLEFLYITLLLRLQWILIKLSQLNISTEIILLPIPNGFKLEILMLPAVAFLVSKCSQVRPVVTGNNSSCIFKSSRQTVKHCWAGCMLWPVRTEQNPANGTTTSDSSSCGGSAFHMGTSRNRGKKQEVEVRKVQVFRKRGKVLKTLLSLSNSGNIPPPPFTH